MKYLRHCFGIKGQLYNTFVRGQAISALYRGYTPLLVQTTLLWGNFFMIDDRVKQWLQQRCNGIGYSSTFALTSLIGGCLQACITVGPETIRIQMQKPTTLSLTMRGTLRHIIHAHGVRSLFYSLPHKFLGHIFRYTYKNGLRDYWVGRDQKPAT